MLAYRIGFLLSTCLWLGCGHITGVKGSNALPPQLFAKKTALKPKASEFRLGQLAQSELKASLASLHAESRVPGVGVGIVFGRQVVWTGVFGYAELENKIPMTADSITRIGSLSKIFTGLTVLSLRDQGRLDLDMPVAKVVPELAQVIYPSKDSPRITFRHLLTHTSRLPRLGVLDYYSKPTSRSLWPISQPLLKVRSSVSAPAPIGCIQISPWASRVWPLTAWPACPCVTI